MEESETQEMERVKSQGIGKLMYMYRTCNDLSQVYRMALR